MAVPFITVEGLVPVLANGIDIWLGSILPVVCFAMVLLLVMALGLHKRRHWYVRYLFAAATLLLIGYLVGLLSGVAILLRFVPILHPDLHFASVLNLIYWFLTAPLAWLLLRMLRLRYWQPWTGPDDWEPGNELPPRRAQRWGLTPRRPDP